MAFPRFPTLFGNLRGALRIHATPEVADADRGAPPQAGTLTSSGCTTPATPPKYFAADTSRDIFLISYPRSGNTWLRSIVAGVETGEIPETLSALDYIVPDIHFSVPAEKMTSRSRYVVKSHGTFRNDYQKVIYVFRDPKEVLLSYYDYLRKAADDARDLKAFAHDWLCGRVWPCSWREHVCSWLDRDVPPGVEMLVLAYDDICGNPSASVRRIASFLKAPCEEADVSRIVSATTRQQMRIRELAGDRARHREAGLRFIGSGEAHARGTLTRDIEAAIDRECQETLQRMTRRFSAGRP